MSYDRQTVNILVLELATMVVAVAVAFGANFLATFDLSDVLYFIFATSVAIWFWWGYVMDRLEFPPKSQRFPLMDVVVLVLIALIPFALRQRNISALSGTLAAVLFAWALLIRRIIRENSDTISAEKVHQLNLEVSQRVLVAVLLSIGVISGLYIPVLGLLILYISGAIAIMWTVLTRRRLEGGKSGTE